MSNDTRLKHFYVLCFADSFIEKKKQAKRVDGNNVSN